MTTKCTATLREGGRTLKCGLPAGHTGLHNDLTDWHGVGK